MANKDLKTIDGIKEQKSIFDQNLETSETLQGWLKNYANFIEKVRVATVEELATEQFQQELWEDKSISGPGMCSVNMTGAIQSEELRAWIAGLRDTGLPDPGEQRVDALTNIHKELIDRARQHTDRNAWLKILRLLAAIFPKDITCLVDHSKLRDVTKAMFGKAPTNRDKAVSMNAQITKRLNEVLGEPENTSEGLATRSSFVWQLFLVATEGEEEEVGELEGEIPGESKLKFLAHDRKLKGITALTGHINTCLRILDFVQDGATIAETLDFFRQDSNIKEGTAKTQLNTVRKTLGLLRLTDGNVLQPSKLGQKLLDTEDPTILIPRVLTRIVGFDLLLYVLKENGTQSRSALMEALQEHYPSWTTASAPSALLAWAQKLQLVEVDDQKNYKLTEEGAEWAEQITAKPKAYSVEVDESSDVVPEEFAAPTLEEILKFFDESPYVFPPDIVAQLHVALHMHPSKHFVLLSGLSGTGKTKLAELYANAYHKTAETKDNNFYHCVVVQPDWTDSTGLLGYVNPLQEIVTYASTQFLKFLISAVAHPKIPHFVCMDEMNLARVEYYFAPFLSAMESEQQIVVHQNDEPVDTIEPSLPWPRNLYIIGTVNMDETTHAFSDKVLDRAFTIEFWEVDLEDFKLRFGKNNPDFSGDILDFAMQHLGEIKTILEPVRQHFGYRTTEEILAFLGTNLSVGANVMNRNVAFDQAILMKTLPKIRGQDSAEFRECLSKLHQYLTGHEFNCSAKKVGQMKEELELTGTTRFWS